MSIDGIISAVRYNADGTATIYLSSRDQYHPVGQSVLTCENPRPGMEVLVGDEVWGGSDRIIRGREQLLFRRVGYTRVRLPDKT